MKYWHAYGGAVDSNGLFVTWEGIKDASGYRKITNDPSNIQHAFDRFLSSLDIDIDSPAGLVSFYKVMIWGTDGILKISGASQEGVLYGDTFSQQEMLELSTDAEFRDFMRLDEETSGGGEGGGGEEEPPGVPENFSVGGYSQEVVSLLWNEPADKGSDPDSLVFVLEYKEQSEGSFSTFGEVAETSADVTGLASDSTYVFRVKSKTDVGQSGYANTVTQKTLPLFPSVQGIFLSANNHPDPVVAADPVVFNDDQGTPANDGETIQVWAYNGGLTTQSLSDKRPIYRTGLSAGGDQFNAVEFQGGTRLRWQDTADFTQSLLGPPEDGIEAIVILRRLHAIPPNTQDSGMWYLTGEPTPPETNDTDTHYPEDNSVLYERFGSDVRRELFPLPVDVTQWHIYQVRGREGEWKLWMNGVLRVNSTSNDLDNAPATNLPTIGVSYFYGPDNESDEVEMYGGHWQCAEMIIFRPYVANIDNNETEEDAAIIRDQTTTDLFEFFKQRYEIQV